MLDIKFVRENPEIVKGVTTFVGVVGTATAGVTAFTAAQVAARAASAAFSKATAVALGPIALGITAVGALAGVAVMLASAYDEANISVGKAKNDNPYKTRLTLSYQSIK